MLTHLAATMPPRIAHAIARWLRLDAVVAMFCPHPCCPDWTAWTPQDIEDTRDVEEALAA